MSLQVLVIDDSATARHLVSQTLNEMGHTVLSATNGGEGLAVIEDEAKPLDIVLCDLVMPDMDGMVLLKQCRILRPGIPFVLITQHTSLDSAIEALRSGAADYLPKPIDPEVLKRRLSAVMAQRLLAQSRDEKNRLEAAMATAGAAAHEISQPLSAIMAHAQLIEATDDVSDMRRRARTIAQEADRMGKIVHKLVNLTQFKTKTYLGQSRILDLNGSEDE